MAVDLLEEELYLKGLSGELNKAADKLLGAVEYYSDRYKEEARYLWENQADLDGPEQRFLNLVLDRVVDSGKKTNSSFIVY